MLTPLADLFYSPDTLTLTTAGFVASHLALFALGAVAAVVLGFRLAEATGPTD